jgi:hypothetical protein
MNKMHAQKKCLLVIFTLRQNGVLPSELIFQIVKEFYFAFRDKLAVRLKEVHLSCMDRVDNPSRWPLKLIIDYDIQSYSQAEMVGHLSLWKPWIGTLRFSSLSL